MSTPAVKQTSIKTSIISAQGLQHAGTWVHNPQYGKVPNVPELVWKAMYAIHWRPDESLPEKDQYAIVEEVT